MNSTATRISSLSSSVCSSLSKTLDFHGSGLRMVRVHHLDRVPQKPLSLVQFPSFKMGMLIVMRDRGKNRKPLQRGRVSIEAIQTVQALKRAKNDSNLLERVFESKFRRLIKSDMIAVLRDLQRQNEALLALQVFEDVRKEYWYKPQVLIYADLITVLASNGLFEKVELVFLDLKMENRLEADTDGFNALLRTLMEFGIYRLSMECFQLMKKVGCEPDESTFRILINGLDSKGETGLSAIFRQEAEKYFGEHLEFLEEKEEISLSN
ncbi:Pentatricopeptide repeat [Macleaya cordata]|uniref:Pentatricopeptide repeat n=1 Tax=Macleaya cordata TaxID=56857 RepID=A0A200PR59_MACCD|nr:Pentatricopeptide repeat [Macleaya cordata]